jgi:general secretion pathway protein A
MMKRTREFQQKMHLHVDGIPGEDTLMQLMRDTNTTPSVLLQLMPHRTRKRRRSIPNVYHLSCGSAQLPPGRRSGFRTAFPA